MISPKEKCLECRNAIYVKDISSLCETYYKPRRKPNKDIYSSLKYGEMLFSNENSCLKSMHIVCVCIYMHLISNIQRNMYYVYLPWSLINLRLLMKKGSK